MSDPVIVREGGDWSNGVIIGIVIAAIVGLVIRAFATGRMDVRDDKPNTVNMNVEAPAELPSVNDVVWPDEAPATNDAPASNDAPATNDGPMIN